MSTETKTVYVVWANTDMTEGRGVEYIKHFCEKESTAQRLAKKGYVMGSDARYTEQTLYKHDGRWFGPVMISSPSEQDSRQEAELARQREAKAKRTAAINRAKGLGLSEEDIALLSEGV
jgi:hypothetical protein